MSLDELHPGRVDVLGDVLFELLVCLAGILVVQRRDLENIARSHSVRDDLDHWVESAAETACEGSGNLRFGSAVKQMRIGLQFSMYFTVCWKNPLLQTLEGGLTQTLAISQHPTLGPGPRRPFPGSVPPRRICVGTCRLALIG